MSPHQAIAVAVRLFAIWLAAYALRAMSAAMLAGHVDSRELVVPGAVCFLTLLVAVLLWFFPLTTARKLLAPVAATPAPAQGADTWLAVGCALIGLWLLATAIPSIIRDLLYLYFSSSDYDDSGEFRRWLAYRVVEVVIALWLIIGTKGIVKAFWWARNAGTSKAT